MKVLLMISFVSGITVAAQAPVTAEQQPADQQTSTPAAQATSQDQGQSPLNVTPGSPVIKPKDYYDRSGTLHPFRRMPEFIGTDQYKIWTSPFHTSKHDAKWWGIWGGTIGGLIVADRYIERNAPTNSTLVRVGTDASYLGEPYTLLPIAAGMYFIGTAKGSDHFRETGLLSFEAVADVTVLQLVLKEALGRERPLEGHGNGAFEQSPSRWNSSFPSGHSITTFAMASVIAHQFHHHWWVKAAIYGYGVGVAGARLAAQKHFPGDVVAGGVMGWFVGDYVYAKRHNPELDGKPTTMSWIADHVHFGPSLQ